MEVVLNRDVVMLDSGLRREEQRGTYENDNGNHWSHGRCEREQFD